MNIKAILVFVAIAAGVGIYILVREKINLRKAADGEDQERLKKAVAQVLPGETGYRVAYGHYEKVEHFGRRTRTTYFCYALAFDASRLWVIPLHFDKELILPRQPILLTGDALGIADVNITNDKEDRTRRVDLTLYDKGGKAFLNCVVEVKNTREDRFHHVNIIQEEACAQFGQFMSAMSAQVNRDNAALREQTHTTESAARKAYTMGILSIVFGVFLSPVGLILSIVGMRTAKAGQSTASLILCRVGLIVSIILTLLYAVAMSVALLR